MILKRLIEEYNFNIELILLKEGKRLKLTGVELQVLLALFSISKKRKTFSVSAISRRVDLSQNEIGLAVESLIQKEYVVINLERKDQKEREVFDLDSTIKKIEDLFREDQIEIDKQQNESKIMTTINLFEEKIGRPLKSTELDIIRSWYEDNLYDHTRIIEAIEQSGLKTSIKYVERFLNQTIPKSVEIDKEVEDVLDGIYKKMR